MLNRLRKAMNEKEQGFTLIELLVVIIIIGILAAIAIPVFLSQRKKGFDASLKSDLRNIATAVESMYTDNPTWQTSTQYGTWAPVNPNGSIGAGFGQNWSEATEDLGIRLSQGNAASIRATAGGYCIRAFNPQASKAVDEGSAMMYDSTAGGVKESGYSAGACAA